MNDSSFRSARESGHDIGPGCLAACLPLLQFDDNDIVVILSVNSGNQEIDPFGCQRNLIFNCYLALIIYLGDIYGISQILQGVCPTAIFSIILMLEVVGGKFILDDGSYGIASDIIDKTAFGVAIDYHGIRNCPRWEKLAYTPNITIIPKCAIAHVKIISVPYFIHILGYGITDFLPRCCGICSCEQPEEDDVRGDAPLPYD